jgi:transposase
MPVAGDPPHLPADRPGRRGRPRVWPLRRIIEAILYVDRTGCAWRYLPSDFPPWQTVYGYFAAWRDDGTLARLHVALRARARAAAGRNPQPTAAVIDSQSVRAADTVPRASRGWDAAKKVNGRKRHIAVDTTGLILDVVITAASVQDRQAARPLLWNTHRACRGVRHFCCHPTRPAPTGHVRAALFMREPSRPMASFRGQTRSKIEQRPSGET